MTEIRFAISYWILTDSFIAFTLLVWAIWPSQSSGSYSVCSCYFYIWKSNLVIFNVKTEEKSIQAHLKEYKCLFTLYFITIKNHLSLTVFGFHLNRKIKPLREGGEKDTSSQREWLFDNKTKEQRRTEEAGRRGSAKIDK